MRPRPMAASWRCSASGTVVSSVSQMPPPPLVAPKPVPLGGSVHKEEHWENGCQGCKRSCRENVAAGQASGSERER